MNALQRTQLRRDRAERNASAPSENTIIPPVQCHMDYCFDSPNGVHIVPRPIANL